MRTLFLVYALLLFAIVGGETLIIADQALADCCMCGQRCKTGCDCPGSTQSCPKCLWPENFIIGDSGELVNEIAVNSDSIDRVMRHAGSRQCPQNNSRLKLIETQDLLKFDAAFLNDKRIQDNVVAFEMTTGNEK